MSYKLLVRRPIPFVFQSNLNLIAIDISVLICMEYMSMHKVLYELLQYIKDTHFNRVRSTLELKIF